MKVKTALDLYKAMEKDIAADKKAIGKAHVTPEELALRTMVGAYLKQRLIIKQLQKQNIQLSKGATRWNNLLSLL